MICYDAHREDKIHINRRTDIDQAFKLPSTADQRQVTAQIFDCYLGSGYSKLIDIPYRLDYLIEPPCG